MTIWPYSDVFGQLPVGSTQCSWKKLEKAQRAQVEGQVNHCWQWKVARPAFYSHLAALRQQLLHLALSLFYIQCQHTAAWLVNIMKGSYFVSFVSFLLFWINWDPHAQSSHNKMHENQKLRHLSICPDLIVEI